MVLQIGHIGKQIRNALKIMKCGAGGGWRSCGPIESREMRNIMRAIASRMADWIGHILRRNWLLQHVTEGNT